MSDQISQGRKCYLPFGSPLCKHLPYLQTILLCIFRKPGVRFRFSHCFPILIGHVRISFSPTSICLWVNDMQGIWNLDFNLLDDPLSVVQIIEKHMTFFDDWTFEVIPQQMSALKKPAAVRTFIGKKGSSSIQMCYSIVHVLGRAGSYPDHSQ
jgi:hypothetical protein